MRPVHILVLKINESAGHLEGESPQPPQKKIGTTGKNNNNNKQRDEPLINKGGTQGTNPHTEVGNLIIPDAMEAVVGVAFDWWRR